MLVKTAKGLSVQHGFVMFTASSRTIEFDEDFPFIGLESLIEYSSVFGFTVKYLRFLDFRCKINEPEDEEAVIEDPNIDPD